MTMGKEDIVVEFSSDVMPMNVWRRRSADNALVPGLRLDETWLSGCANRTRANRSPPKTDGRGRAIRLLDRCFVENLAQHF